MSSNPQAKAEVSANPSKLAVNKPVNAEEQQADIQRKLKLYGIWKAFGEGKLPSNAQADSALQYALTNSPVDIDKLSPDGKLLIEDVRDIIETARVMLTEKNQGDLLQEFIWNTYQGDTSRGAKSKDEVLPVGKEDVKADGQQAAAHLRTLFTLFFTNSEARKLLNDVGYIGRDMFATAAQRGAEKVRPDQETLDQVEKPAPSGEWIGADGQKHGRDETPELQLKGPGGSEFRMHPKDDPADAKVRDPNGNEKSAGDAYQQGKEAYGQYQDTKQQLKSDAFNHASDVAQSDDPAATAQAKKEQAKGVANQYDADYDVQGQAGSTKQRLQEEYDNTPGNSKTDKALNKIPDKHRERAQKGIHETREIFDEHMPKERRDQFIYRLKKVVCENQEHKDYQAAVTFFLDKAEHYKAHGKHVAGKGGESTQAVAEDPAYQAAFIQFRTLLERFANNQSMEPLLDAIDALYTDAQNDSELRAWWGKVDDYVHAVLLEPGFILEDESSRQYNELKDEGKRFFDEKYKGHRENFTNELTNFFGAMGEDPLNKRLGTDIQALVKDVLFDSEGSLTFKPHLWNDIRRVIVPSLAKHIGYIPIPRAEYSDDKLDLTVEGLVLQGSNLLPNIVTMDAWNSFEFSPYDSIPDKNAHSVTIGFSQVQFDLRDVLFQFRRKSGWPKLSDRGLADVFLGGKGLSVKVGVKSAKPTSDSVFDIEKVDVSLDSLKFSIRDSKHDILYKFLKGPATTIIKKAIVAAVDGAIRTALGHLDDQLVEVRRHVEEAKKSDDTTRKEALQNLYKQKKDAAKAKKAKADEKTGEFRIVTDQSDQLVQDIDGKAQAKSWTKSAFRIEDSIGTSNDWRSPIFSIVGDDKHPAVTGQVHPQANISTSGHGTKAPAAPASTTGSTVPNTSASAPAVSAY